MEHLSHTTTETTDQGDEEIITSTLSDEALEAAAGPERDPYKSLLALTGQGPGDCC